MHVIKEGPLPHFPYACAVTSRADGEVLDLSVELPAGRDQRLYLRRPVVEEAGRMFGMVPQHEVDELRARLDAYGEEVAALREQVGQYTTAREAEQALAQAI